MTVEQRFAAGADRLDVFALLAVSARLEQQAGHADDRVHRRADLVAHVGEELALRLRRRLRRFLGGFRSPSWDLRALMSRRITV